MADHSDSGLKLDRNFDFSVSDWGDVEASMNAEELIKDLSGIIAGIVDGNLIGNRLSTNEMVVLETNIVNAVEEDERVNEVLWIRTNPNISEDSATIYLAIDSIYGEEELAV